MSILNQDNFPKCKSNCVPPKDKDLDKIQYTLASKVGEERCVLPTSRNTCVTAETSNYLSRHQSFEII